MICYLVKRKGRRLWRGRYRLAGMPKPIEVPLRTADKQVAQTKLLNIVKEAEQERAGIIAPKSLRDGAQRRLKEHLADYTRDLEKLGRDSMYVYNVEKLVERLLAECNWDFPMDVTADSFQGWRGNQDKAPKTLNEYLSTMGAFLNWLVCNKRLMANPLISAQRVETRGKERRKRRALTHDEVCRLLHVAGHYRIVYLTALFTGLRRAELAKLVWDDVHLEAPKPFIAARASTTKNHEDAILWLHDELAAVLRSHRPKNPASSDPVFPEMPRMDHLKAHLRAAGIPYIDDQGRQADFHSLRHTFGTNLSLAEIPPRLAMQLMRHSDMRLTMNIYTDATQLPTAGAIDKLPRFNVSGPQIGPLSLGASSPEESQPVAGEPGANARKALESKG